MNSGKILLKTHDFFSELVAEAFVERKIETYPLVKDYLAQVLEFYLTTDNLFTIQRENGKKEQETLAEMYLKAVNEPSISVRVEKLKQLADSSLYISGFFGDSLKRKVVDVDYYADIGGIAYGCLAEQAAEDLHSRVFHEFATRFVDFVDVLTLISQKAMVQTNKDLLRLFDRYIATGSALARDQLAEQGLLSIQL